jgi:hypothetical protein
MQYLNHTQQRELLGLHKTCEAARILKMNEQRLYFLIRKNKVPGPSHYYAESKIQFYLTSELAGLEQAVDTYEKRIKKRRGRPSKVQKVLGK